MSPDFLNVLNVVTNIKGKLSTTTTSITINLNVTYDQ